MSALAHSSSHHAGNLETLLEIHDRASRKAGLAQQSAESISEYLALVSRRLIVAANNAELKRSRVHRLFSGRDFSHVDLSGLKLKNLDFTRCNLSHATMRKMSADQCQFERAWMSSVDARGAWFKHCDFGQTLTWRMYNFEGAEFQSCEFFRSDFSLRASGLTGVLFKHCTMPNGDHVHGYVRLLGRDKRDYELMALQRLDGEFNVWAGCQKFRTIDEAVAHWGAEDYTEERSRAGGSSSGSRSCGPTRSFTACPRGPSSWRRPTHRSRQACEWTRRRTTRCRPANRCTPR